MLAFAFILAAVVSWRRWPDLIVDFGGQLYIPWRLADGAVLYRDLFYFAGGPLSQYFNALLFKIFGVSFSTLIIANLTLTAALVVLIYRRFAAAADVVTAVTIGLGIILVFAFEQTGTTGNYNYLAPYAHEMLHGLFLAILAVMLLADWLARKQIRFAIAAGFCSGLVALTKPEIFVALAAACAVALILVLIVRREIRFGLQSTGAFVCAAFVPLLGFFLFFLRVENWRESVRSVFFGWWPVFQTSVASSPYYQWCLGFDNPYAHLRTMGGHFLWIAGGVSFYAIAFRWMKSQKSGFVKNVLPWLLMAPLIIWAIRFDWHDCGASLPLLAFATVVFLRVNIKSFEPEKAVFPLLWSSFSLVLLLKLGVFPRIWHYGFVLAMPAFATAVYLLLWLLPQLLEKRFQMPARLFRAAVWLVLMTGFIQLFSQSEKIYASKNLAVGQAGDRILGFGPKGNAVEARTTGEALAWIDTNVPPDATLACLPQGVMLNYLSRRINPTPCLDWNPTMFAVFSQKKMTSAFEQNPPDYVVLVEWKTYEFGIGYFGQEPGYGVDVMRWIENNYTPVKLFGSEPLQKGLFGMKVLKRIPATTR